MPSLSANREEEMSKPAHLIDGEFQSDKYPTCPRGKVPLSTKDPNAHDLLWIYAQRRRSVDVEFAADLETALRLHGFTPPSPDMTLYVKAVKLEKRRTFTVGQDVWLAWYECIEACIVVSVDGDNVHLESEFGNYVSHWTRVHEDPVEASRIRDYVKEPSPYPVCKDVITLSAIEPYRVR